MYDGLTVSSDIDLHHLRSFVAVATHLSFRQAARAMYLDQGAVSRHIQCLERDLGVRLLDRDTRTVHLTEAGRVLLWESGNLFAFVDRLRDRVARSEDGGRVP